MTRTLTSTPSSLAAVLDADEYPEADGINEQLALGERFSKLDSGDDNSLFTSSGEGSGGGGASGSGGGSFGSRSKEPAIRIMNQSPLERNKRRKKNRGHRMLLDSLYDAAISGSLIELHWAKTLLAPLNRPPFL